MRVDAGPTLVNAPSVDEVNFLPDADVTPPVRELVLKDGELVARDGRIV